MSGNGDCCDNAVMESFWDTLKTELVNHERYETRNRPVVDLRARRGVLQPASPPHLLYLIS
jgi:transposase InsO family protein